MQVIFEEETGGDLIDALFLKTFPATDEILSSRVSGQSFVPLDDRFGQRLANPLSQATGARRRWPFCSAHIQGQADNNGINIHLLGEITNPPGILAEPSGAHNR